MNLQESGEMYLETILVLSKRNKDVRSIDIAHELNYSKPSVSRAIGLLKKDEYIIVDSKGYIELTDKGLKVATTIYDRHDTLSSFLKVSVYLMTLLLMMHVVSNMLFLMKQWIKLKNIWKIAQRAIFYYINKKGK